MKLKLIHLRKNTKMTEMPKRLKLTSLKGDAEVQLVPGEVRQVLRLDAAQEDQALSRDLQVPRPSLLRGQVCPRVGRPRAAGISRQRGGALQLPQMQPPLPGWQFNRLTVFRAIFRLIFGPFVCPRSGSTVVKLAQNVQNWKLMHMYCIFFK